MLAIYTSIAKGDEDQQDTITSQYVSPTTVQIFTQVLPNYPIDYQLVQ